MSEWLLTPAKVSTFLGGSKYPTLTVATLSYNCLLAHCNKYLGADSQVPESSPDALIQEVEQSASNSCLQYLIKYQDTLKSVPARVAAFLDPRIPVPTNTIELSLDVQLVEKIMEADYSMHSTDLTPASATQESGYEVPLPEDFLKAYESLDLDLDELSAEDDVIDYILTDNHGRIVE
ncbi:hypothetical protein R1sor_001531 [Riccia sorocarpa]|uniref:Uncharacterized protein n=1 Tax=Riccia sorocarpa TaxID=122646 RepID=A0ABD3H260_9MARC